MPSGFIGMWSGAVVNIPAGWLLCDGENNTPNLVDKFIKGASVAGATGGSSSHTHTNTLNVDPHTLTEAQMPSHSHDITVQDAHQYTGKVCDSGAGVISSLSTGATGGNEAHAHSLSGAIEEANNEPPFFALCFIIKE